MDHTTDARPRSGKRDIPEIRARTVPIKVRPRCLCHPSLAATRVDVALRGERRVQLYCRTHRKRGGRQHGHSGS
eukprot:3713244-Rhodomonas_salina.1